jgi:hypothetical protein
MNFLHKKYNVAEFSGTLLAVNHLIPHAARTETMQGG